MRFRFPFSIRKLRKQLIKEERFTIKFNYTLSIFIFILGLALTALVMWDTRKPHAEFLPSTPKPTPNSSEIVREFTTDTYSIWKIEYNRSIDPLMPYMSDVVYMQPDNEGNDLNHTTRWKNYLIQNNYKTLILGDSTTINGTKVSHVIDAINVFNLETQQQFSIPIDELGEPFISTEIQDFNMQIVGNRLYFGYGNRFGPLLTHYMNLPLTGKSRPIELITSPGGRIELTKGFYFGSACYESCAYSIVNPQNNQITPLVRAARGTGINASSNEAYIGLTTRGGEIFALYDSTQDYIERLIAAPYRDENATILLINKARMPNRVVGAELHESLDFVALIGETIHVYNIKKDTLEEIPDAFVKDAFDGVMYKEDVLCLHSPEKENPWFMAVNIITKEVILDTATICTNEVKPVSKDDRMQANFNQLGLSAEYRVTKEDRSYETYRIR